MTPFQPAGWSDKIVVSTSTGTHFDSAPLRITDTLFVDWAALNNGTSATPVRFFTKIFVDGIERASWFSDPPLDANFYVFVEDFSIGTLSAGTHTVRIVADVFNNIAESNEFDNEYTKTITVSLPGQPNLTPFQPAGWSDKIVVSTSTGTHFDSAPLRTTDTLFVDWAALNNGTSATPVRFFTKIFVDGIEKASWFSDPPLEVNFFVFVEDFSIGTLSAGTHTIRIAADALGNIAESNEFDNEYTKTITVSLPGQPNLTPFQPAGWSDRIVVSNVIGSHADSSPLRSTDTLFVDWAAINNGLASTSTRFFTKLYVDGVERTSWFTDPPLNPNFFVFVEDFSIGSLGPGTHTIKIVADALSNISESNEFDNEFTKTISISSPNCIALTVNVSPSNGGIISRTPEPNCSSLLAAPTEAILQPASESPTSTAQLDGFSPTGASDKDLTVIKSKAEAGGSVRVIVRLRTSFQPEGNLSSQALQSQHRTIKEAQDALLTWMSAFNIQSLKRFETVPYLAMEVNAESLRHLESSPDVQSIEEDVSAPPSLAESVPLIGAPGAWAAGFSGAGQAVAILDSGVDKNHPFLSGKVVSEACYSSTTSTSASLCPAGASESTSSGSGINCDTFITEGCLHGTHVAGIAAGRGFNFSGVARDANIIAIQVFSRFNRREDCGSERLPCIRTFVSDQMKGLERVLTLAGSFSIAAVNMSLGGGKFTSNCDSDPRKSLIDNLRSRGIATVISSGNEEFVDSLGSPGCISSAISVGSTGDGSGGAPRDVVSPFSNSASFLKLLAPGDSIISSIPGGGFASESGTSMAAPHVTGAWAILKSKAPAASVDQILSALSITGVSITDFRNGIAKPRIQVDAALNALAGGGGGVLSYSFGNVVTLTANPNAGFAFVKWQRDGIDFSTNRTVSVAMNSSQSMTAVFRVSTGPTISSVSQDSAKVTRISGGSFGLFPRVLINGIDRSDFINSNSDTQIVLKGKQKKVGLRSGDNTVQIVDSNGVASNVAILRL